MLTLTCMWKSLEMASICLSKNWASLMAGVVKNLPEMQETRV